jgi:Ca-activated chloride channel family protein
MPDSAPFSLTFARPDALWLLLALPVFALLGLWLGVRRRRLGRAALVLRVAVVALLAVGLAEPLLTTDDVAASTVFVVDRSRSVADDTASSAAAWVTDALAEAGSGDRAAVVEFGAAPAVAAPAGPAREVGEAWASGAGLGVETDREYTDVESALALARALPLGGARRIVLVSDGAENVGSALAQADQSAAEGVPIDVAPVEGVGERDLRVEGVTAPSSAWLGEPVTVLASVSAGVAGPGRVELWVDGAMTEVKETNLPVGLSSHAFEQTELPAGFHGIEVRVVGSAEGDRYPQNNLAPLALVVRDQPRLLLVSAEDADSGLLRGALARSGAAVETIAPAQVPSRLSELGEYDAFVLDNVPIADLSYDQVIGLREATRELGRGLVVVGGTSSYGPGAYAQTPLEETLPVTVRVTDGRQRQRVALLLIMDKSGSMSYDPLGGTGKIEMAKEAVRLAARSLAEEDQVGVIVFNDRQEWAVPMTVIDGEQTRQAIDNQINAITPDGGTEILPALSVGLDAIRNVDADVRHIVLLSDGKARTGTREGYQQLLDDAMSDRTTLSTIAIGEDADQDLLNFLADEGGGNYHFTERAEEIPQVTLAEAQSAGSQSVIRGTFRPIQTLPSPILAAFAPEDLPDLEGYDFAEAKPDAQVVLTSDRDDPVLAKWQFGLGRVVAWTADSGVDLAAPWAQWQGYDAFWAGMVRWALPDPENRSLQVGVERDGPEAVVTVDAVGEAGDFVDAAATTATITTPSGAVVADRPLAQTGPGEYQLRVAAPEPGAYQVELTQRRGDRAVTETAGFAVPPSPELQPAPEAPALLRAIAARTGGRVLSLDDPTQAFAAGGDLRGSPLREYQALWWAPLGAALALLLAEIAVRMGVFGAAARLVQARSRA